MQIPKPSPAKQEKAVAVFEAFRTNMAEIIGHITTTQQILSSLRNAQIGQPPVFNEENTTEAAYVVR